MTLIQIQCICVQLCAAVNVRYVKFAVQNKVKVEHVVQTSPSSCPMCEKKLLLILSVTANHCSDVLYFLSGIGPALLAAHKL